MHIYKMHLLFLRGMLNVMRNFNYFYSQLDLMVFAFFAISVD